MTEWAMGLVKVASPLATRLASEGWSRVAQSYLVTFDVRREAKRASIHAPSYRTLRAFVTSGAPERTFRSGDPEQFMALLREVRALGGTSHLQDLDEESAKTLVRFLLSAYTKRAGLREAIEAQVQSSTAELTAQFDRVREAASEAALTESLRKLPPVRAEQARRLVGDSPVCRRLVGELADAASKGTAIEDWYFNRPSWMRDMPAAIRLWLAELAADFGLVHVAVGFIDEALADGATPSAYWRLRRDLMNAGDDDVALQRSVLEEHALAHPLAQAMLSALDGAADAGLERLDAWIDPDPGATALRTSIRCQLLMANQDVEVAVREARRALQEAHLSAPARLVAERLLLRGYQRESTLHFADLETSLALAIEARDTTRAWGGPSGAAVVIAIEAAQALGNRELAWSLSQPPPAGQATAGEAGSPDVLKLAALLAAEFRPVPEAERLLAALDDPLTRVEAAALLAERRDQDEARRLWISAASGAKARAHQLRIGFQIALHGTVPEDVDALSRAQVSELTLIAQAVAGKPGCLDTLRGRAAGSRTLAFALVVILSRSDDVAAAATAAASAARSWADANMWTTSARLYLNAGDPARGAEAARSAIQVAPPTWGERSSAYALLVEALTAMGRWTEATDAAAEFLARDPQNESAAWALVLCQLKLGQVTEAWATYSVYGGRPKPRNEREALARILLWKHCEASETALDDLFEVVDAFDTNHVREAAAHCLLYFPETASADASERIRKRLALLIESLPDVFVPHEIDEDDPRKTLDAMVAGLPDTSDHDQRVDNGELPFGAAASVHRRSYAYLLSCRTGVVFAGDASTFEREVEAARSARGQATVVDVSALATIELLDPEIGDQLLGYLGSVTGELSQRLDALRAEDDLSRRSTMTVGRSPDGTAQICTITDDEAGQRHERAQRLKGRLLSLPIAERKGPTKLPIRASHAQHFIWLDALDLALDPPIRAFWCDDAPLRGLAAQMGLITFSTQALIEAVRLDGLVSDVLAEALQAILITHHYVGLDFREDWLTAAAEMEGWQPGGAATFIRWSPPTSTPESRIRFVLDAVERSMSSPIAIEGWIAAASQWLVRVGGADGRTNLIWLMQLVLAQPWLNAARLPFVLRGIRAAAIVGRLEDPIEDAIRAHYRQVSARAGHAVAAIYLRDLLSMAGTEDRTAAVRVTLTS